VTTCEVCVEGVPGAKAAEAGRAHRIELCAGLVEGGTTPSIGTISKALEIVAIPIMVLIRPRGGDFLYTAEELGALLGDVEAVREAGAFGIATGVLTKEGDVDLPAMEQIMDAAGPLSVTFHRAFDMTRDPHASLETLIQLGVDRVLTSGQEWSAPEGLDLIGRLVESSDGRISVMPGGGIREDNVRGIIQKTGVKEVHFAAFSSLDSPMVHRNTRPLMGSDRVPGEYEKLVTDSEQVRGVVEAAGSAPQGKP
jgi:copper homeostasis protein